MAARDQQWDDDDSEDTSSEEEDMDDSDEEDDDDVRKGDNDMVVQYVYDERDFKDIPEDKNFVNEGEVHFQKLRDEWTKNSTNTERQEEELNDINIEEVMGCLRAYKQFQQPIPLASMVEILTVLWEEEGTQ